MKRAGATLHMPDVKTATIDLAGGLDQLTPTIKLKPGFVRNAQNFECAPIGGYARINGYERVDGRTAPSSATYGLVQVVSFTNVPSVGQTLTGFSSGATGTIIAVDTTNKYIALTQIVGTFSSSEVVKVGATTIGTATPITVTLTSKLNAQYLALAANVYRALIGAVPGSGPVRGAVGATFGGVEKRYAFRDNALATATILHEASGAGWTPVTLFNEVGFTTGGASAPAEGATLTQGAHTATIKRVVLESGSWAGGTAAGRLIVTTPAPGNFAAGAATVGAIAMTLTGAQTAISFAVGGKFEFDVKNFGGQLTTKRIYGADNVNRCFEFDGTVLVPIRTFAPVDAPKHIKVHKNHLFVSIGSSAMHSGPGTPYIFGAAGGGGEIACGDVLTNFLVQPGSQASPAMMICCQSTTFMLYGSAASGSNPWNLVSFNTGTGGIAYTAQNLDHSYVFDTRGVISLQTALQFGNFLTTTLTSVLQPFIIDKRTTMTYSVLCKNRNQYRVFCSDGSGLYITLVNGKLLGSMPIRFPNPLFCVYGYDQANGEEAIYAGAASGGFVYQLEKGSSFDGDNIDAFITLNWAALKSPRILKRFRRASLEMSGNFFAEIQFGYSLAYGTDELDQSIALVAFESSFRGSPVWDAFIWDMVYWDGVTLAPSEIKLDGTAENIQITIQSTTNYIYQYTLNSLILHYTDRRQLR